jgi:hypothetical protein
MTAEERGDMVEDLLPQAANLVALVHGDGGPQDVHQALARLDATQKEALLVILAALVDPDQPMTKSLGWVDFDEHGRTIVPPAWQQRETLRDLIPEPDLEDADTYVDEVAVQHYLDGKRVPVTNRERLEAVAAGVRQGMAFLDFDAMHGLKDNSTATFVSRMRKRFAESGEAFPIPERPGKGKALLTDAQVVQIREQYAAGGVTDLELGLQYGVSRKVIGNLLSGKSYPNAGGPIRSRRVNKPGKNTREIWGHGKAGFTPKGDETKEVAA